MKDYSIETFKKLINILTKSNLPTEKKDLIAQMIIDELSNVHCDNYNTKCPHSNLLSVGEGQWTIKCEDSKEILRHSRENHQRHLSDCPYDDFFKDAKKFIK